MADKDKLKALELAVARSRSSSARAPSCAGQGRSAGEHRCDLDGLAGA